MIHDQLESVISQLEKSDADPKQIQALREIGRRVKFIEELLRRHLPEITDETPQEVI